MSSSAGDNGSGPSGAGPSAAPGGGEPQPHGEAELRDLITGQVAALSGLDPADIDPDRPLEEYGLSSRDAMAVAGYLETLLDRPLPPTLAWDHPTVSALASAMAGLITPPPAAASASRPARTPWRSGQAGSAGRAHEPVAVVGLGCRFPGGEAGTLGDPDRFWNFVLDRQDGVGVVPQERWAAFDDGSPAVAEALSGVTRWAAVLDDIAGFDAAFFGISPAEATAMDPQQRILLEVSWEALEHAGIAPRSLRGSRTGVFSGISAVEYSHLTAADLTRIDAWTATGAAASVAAGRLSYLLDLRGPSLVVDTACSSSLVAVHLAVNALRSAECDLALAGGVNLLLSPVITMTFDAGGGTSPDGRCRAFDAAANGMVRGEGCGVVVLKRLADARRDGDRVLAVIAGTAVNSDGRSNGLVAPNGEAQRNLLRAAYEAAGIDPAEVDYVEAHGTGTPLGDPIEAAALGEILGAGRPEERPLLLGSVKSNIGHLEAAAGVAGLIKAVLAMAHRRIPPSAHFSSPSPHIPFGELGIAVATEPVQWPAAGRPPVAGVSAFGFSGTNAHVVLTAGDDDLPQGPGGAAARPVSCLLSDASPERVRDQAAYLAAWLGRSSAGNGGGPDPVRLTETLARRAGRGPSRAVVVARDTGELVDGLSALGAGRPHPAVVAGTDGQVGPGVVFVFSGYGSQWPGMGRALAEAEPVFADALAELESPIRAAAGVSIGEALLGQPSGQRAAGVERAQPLLFGVQVALARLWAARGVTPAAVIGHSMGEVAAAVVSGALTVDDGAHVIACRSRLLGRLTGGGAMALIGLPAEEVTVLAADLPDVHLAVISSPAQAVVTGHAAQIDKLAKRAGDRGGTVRVLMAEGAGHSPQVDPLVPELAAQLAGITARPGRVRFYSTVHEDPRTPPRCDAAYWAANMRQPVRLAPAVAAAANDGLRTFVEISPHPLLARALVETLEHAGAGPYAGRGAGHGTGRGGGHGTGRGVVTGTLRRDGDDVLTFYTNLAALTASGLKVDGPAMGPVIDIPPAPWRHQRYWPEPPRPARPAGHPILGPHVQLPDGGGHAWQAPVGPDDLPAAGTMRHGLAVFPLSAAAEMVLAAACEAWAAAVTDVLVTDLRLEQLLALDTGPELTVLTTTLQEDAGPPGSPRATVRIHARDEAGSWILVATGQVAVSATAYDGPAPTAADTTAADTTAADTTAADTTAADTTAADTTAATASAAAAADTTTTTAVANGAPAATAAAAAAAVAGAEANGAVAAPGSSGGHKTRVAKATQSPGQRIPAEVLDGCLAAACGDAADIPIAIGLLRVPGVAAAGGHCHLRPGRNTGGAVTTADISLLAGSAGVAEQSDQPLLEAREVRVRRTPRAEIRVPYRSKLLELRWHPQPLPAEPATAEHRWIVLGPPAERSGTPERAVEQAGPPAADSGVSEPAVQRAAPLGDDVHTAAGESAGLAAALAAVLHKAGQLASVTAIPQDGHVPSAGPVPAGEAVVSAGAVPGGEAVLSAGLVPTGEGVPYAEALAEEAAGRAQRAADAPVAGIVLLAPAAPLSPAAAEQFVLAAAHVATTMGAGPGPLPRLWLVTTGAAALRQGETGDPGLAAVRGLVRVLALERPLLRATQVDLDPAADAPAAAAALAAELVAGQADDEVAWRAGDRLVARLTPAGARPTAVNGGAARQVGPGDEAGVTGQASHANKAGASRQAGPVQEAGATGQAGAARLVGPGHVAGATRQAGGTAGRRSRRTVVRPSGAYIITGGLGGLGLVIARWLASRGAGRIVLAGRSAPGAAASATLTELRAMGCDVHVVRGDVAEPAIARQLVATAQRGEHPDQRPGEHSGRLCGIVHAAGVFADSLIDDMTPAALSQVWTPKAAGALALHDACDSADLDWFVLFSSAAALLGSPGQAAYATANAWLDGFAVWRRAQGLPAIAIGWGVWSQAGRAGDVMIQGIDPLSPDEGIEALEALLAENRVVAGVARIDPAIAAGAYPEIARIPFFGLLQGQAGRADAGAAWPGRDGIRAAAPEHRRNLVGERVRSQVAAVLGLPTDSVTGDLVPSDAGMDSLAAQRIANLLEYDLAVAIEPGMLLGGATVARLEAFAIAAFEDPSGAPGAVAPAAPAAPAAAASPGGTTPTARGTAPGGTAPGGAFPGGTAAGGAAAGVEPRDAAERKVVRVAADVLGTGPIGVTDDLRALGLTDAARQEIATRLAAEIGCPVDAATLFDVPTAEAVAETIRQAEDAEVTELVRELRPGGLRPPLLLAHPAGGTSGVYKMLAELLGDVGPVLGLERLEGSVSDRAARYRAEIAARLPAQTCVLGGWSFGGVLAYETARQLAAAGWPPALVVLLDAALPLPVAPGSQDRVLAHRFAAFASYLTRTYGRPVPLAEEELYGLAEDAQLELVTARMTAAGLTDALSPAILRHQLTSHEDTRALERYEAGPYGGRVVLYRAEGETPWAVRDPRYQITDETRGWGALCGQLEVVGVDAHHLNLLDPPAVDVIAAHLRKLLTSHGGEK